MRNETGSNADAEEADTQPPDILTNSAINSNFNNRNEQTERTELLAPESTISYQSFSRFPSEQESTTVKTELELLVFHSLPLAVTFFLQYSLVMASFLSVGHLGKVELGAVSLGAMTSSITGIAFVQGMSTCLDTLCSQAFGSGRPDLVGLYFQKGCLLVLVGLTPILVLWYNSSWFLKFIVATNGKESEELIHLAKKYLQIMIFAMPGYTLFECGKRFLQAQDIFHASTIILVVSAPLNVLLTYVLVWDKHVGMGFVGAPTAIAITYNMLAVLMLLYVLFIDGKKCWNGFTLEVFKNWGPLVNLAIPGLVMIESEFLAYEVMTMASSYLGTDDLAAQTIMSSITSLGYEIPFAIGCAAATRIANLIGAGSSKSAKLSASVSTGFGLGVGVFNALIIVTFRKQLAGFFSNDKDVVAKAVKYIPLCAFMHLLDSVSAVMAGILRGQGRQHIGGYINLICYYLVGVPLGLLLCFSAKLGLFGIWLGFIIALTLVALSSVVALKQSNWSACVRIANGVNSP